MAFSFSSYFLQNLLPYPYVSKFFINLNKNKITKLSENLFGLGIEKYLYLMYGKEEAYELRKLFWTSFGKFMKRHHSVGNEKINWMNYKTGIKDLYFRLESGKKTAKICVDLQMQDTDIREIYYAQFKEVKTVFHDLTNAEWNWNETYTNDYNVTLSRISIEIDDVNMYDKNAWQKIFTFYEKHLLGMDEFWVEFKDLFKQLE